MVAFGIGLAEIVARQAQADIETQANERFGLHNKRLADEIQRRLNLPVHGLHGASGAYAASHLVDRDEFRAYVASRDMDLNFPGVLGFGFIKQVQHDDIEAFLERERADQAPEFTLRGRRDAPDLFVITVIEPLSRNLAALGLDLGANGPRRKAIERAIASGQLAMTGAIILVQDSEQTPGVLILLPIYRNGAQPRTPAERQQQLVGLVYAPLITHQLLGQIERITDQLTACRVTLVSDEALTKAIYNTADFDQQAARQASFRIPFGGQVLAVETKANARFEATVDQRMPWLIRIGGGSVSVLLAGVFWLLARGRSRAENRAREMTLDLQTAQRQLESALSEARALQQVIEQHLIVSVTDLHGKIIDVNPAFEQISGYTRAELLGSTHRMVNSYLHPAAFWDDMWRSLTAKKSWRGEVCNRAKNGSLYWVDTIIAPFVNAAGEVERYVSVRSDITARKQFAHELQRTSHTLQLILDSATSVSVIATDTAGIIQTFNAGAEVMLGYAAHELIGLHTPALIHDSKEVSARGAEMSRDLGHALSGFEVFVANIQRPDSQETREWTYIRKDGSRLTVLLCITAMRNADGNIGGYLGVAHDISARKAYEHGLAEAKRAAEALAQARISFLANMSHEIRTPLNGMLGMTELLLGTRLNPEQVDYAHTAYHSGQALLVIINDILDFSKIEADRLVLEAVSVDLPQLIYNVSDLFRTSLATVNLELLVRIAPDLPQQVLGDPGRIRQILTNLVSNAVKFTRRGHILIEATWRPDGVRLAVSDTGIGIAEDAMGRLFNAFEQADVTTSRRFGGTGLGLAISRRLARLMNGDLTVTSNLGQGSTFTADLPLAIVANKPLPMPAMPGMKLLIVDASATNRRIVAEQLTSLQIDSATSADTGAAFGELFAAAAGGDPFTGILLDQQAPGMPSAEFISVLRSHGELGHLQVMLMSALGRRSAPADLEGLGIAGYLAKPTPIATLAEILLGIADQERSSRPIPVTRYSVAAAPSSAPAAPTPGIPNTLILLADDSPVNQRIAQLMLGKLGYEVHVASDGREAVELSARTAYDLIFMDCQMPEMDGFQATTAIRIREATTNAHTPIVALTANALNGDRERCLAAGMDDYLAKPMREKDLAAMAERWLTLTR